MLAAAAVALAAAAAGGPPEAGSKPHIISILQVLYPHPNPLFFPVAQLALPLLAQDDLGYDDTGIHNPAAAAWTKNITALAKEGIVLTNHCAPPSDPPTAPPHLPCRGSRGAG